jgi:CubicO group peptidase (beta-lactamase class C family)
MGFRRGLILFAWLASMTAVSAAPVPDAAIAGQVQAALERAVAADGPGAVVLVAKGDTVLFRGARGQAQIELGVPLAADQCSASPPSPRSSRPPRC